MNGIISLICGVLWATLTIAAGLAAKDEEAVGALIMAGVGALALAFGVWVSS